MPPLSDNADQIVEQAQNAASVEMIDGTSMNTTITEEAATLRERLEEEAPSEVDAGMQAYYAWADREYPNWREVKK